MKLCNAGLVAVGVSASLLVAFVTGCAVEARPYGPRVYMRPGPPPPAYVVVPAPPAPPPPPVYVVEPAPPGAPPPAPAIVAPAPAYAYAYAPDSYVWDGYEYVGVWGDQYVYWGGSAWIICDPIRLERFHGWEHHNPGWHSRAIPYRRERLSR